MVHFFKNALSISASFIFLTSLILFSSCGDDDVADTISPEVSFANLTDQSEVFNTVSVTVNAADNDGVEKVEVYIDGMLTSTLTQSPYEYSWDSNKVTDGAHTIKAVVTDKAGNKTEKVISVNVSNILVSLNMASDQLLANENTTEHGYIFLSDESGKVIAYTECENGKNYQLKNSSFTGSSFYLTELVVRTFADGDSWYTLDTYSQLERGENWVLVKNNKSEVYAGSATLNFSNGDEHSFYSVSAGDVENFLYDSDNISKTLRLFTNPSTVFIKRTGADESVSYGLFPNVTVGDNSIDLSKADREFTSASIALPEGTTASSISIFGLPVANGFAQRCWTGWQSADNGAAKLNLKYPGTDFPMYYWIFYYEAPDAFYSTASTNASFQLEDNITNNVSVAFADGKITYSASGNFDALILQNDFKNGTWNYILPRGTNQVLPTLEIPEPLSIYTLPTLSEPVGYGIYEFGSIDSYDEMKSDIRQSAGGFDDLFSFGNTYKYKFYRGSSSGGRKSNASKRKHGLW